MEVYSKTLDRYQYYFLIGLLVLEFFIASLKLLYSLIRFLFCKYLFTKEKDFHTLVTRKSNQSFIEYMDQESEFEVEIMEIEDKIDFGEFINEDDIKQIEDMARIEEDIAE